MRRMTVPVTMGGNMRLRVLGGTKASAISMREHSAEVPNLCPIVSLGSSFDGSGTYKYPYASGHAPRARVPFIMTIGQVPSAYKSVKMLDAVERVAKLVPTTVINPVPIKYFPPVKGSLMRVIWTAESIPQAMRETATIWFCVLPLNPNSLAKMIGGVMRPPSIASACWNLGCREMRGRTREGRGRRTRR